MVRPFLPVTVPRSSVPLTTTLPVVASKASRRVRWTGTTSWARLTHGSTTARIVAAKSRICFMFPLVDCRDESNTGFVGSLRTSDARNCQHVQGFLMHALWTAGLLKRFQGGMMGAELRGGLILRVSVLKRGAVALMRYLFSRAANPIT